MSQKANDLRQEIHRLWSRLHIPDDEKQSSSSIMNGHINQQILNDVSLVSKGQLALNLNVPYKCYAVILMLVDCSVEDRCCLN